MKVMTNVVRNDLDDASLAALCSSGEVACDIETTGLDPKLDRIGTVQLHAQGIDDIVLQVGDVRPGRLCALIQDSRVRKVFHHAMFDLRFMAAHWRVQPMNIACTKIASKLLSPQVDSKRHSLQALLRERLNVDISKDERLSDWTNLNLTSAQVRYATADVEHLLPLLNGLEEDLRVAGLIDLFDQCTSFIPARVCLDLGGWPDVFNY
ncbi:ribonuclease D [Micromonospora sp. 067-2]|uniref:ribonuclease D n=1 Tax=Micromonospora sp. 067-2 TaxID=2789270 RepID=UPI00397891DE